MKKLITQILFLITINCYSQKDSSYRKWLIIKPIWNVDTVIRYDSVRLKITKVRTVEDRNIYWLKSITKDTTFLVTRHSIRMVKKRIRYITQCKCESKRKKGEWVSIARKDLIIEREVFRKSDLEN